MNPMNWLRSQGDVTIHLGGAISMSHNHHQKQPQLSGEPGFSLVELMVAVGIIAILAILATTSFKTYQRKAKIAVAKAEIKGIEKAIKEFRIGNEGKYPHEFSTCCWWSGDIKSNEFDQVPGFGLSNMVDPWGNPYYVDNCGSAAAPCTTPDDEPPWGRSIFSGGPDGEMVVYKGTYTPNNGPDEMLEDDIVIWLYNGESYP